MFSHNKFLSKVKEDDESIELHSRKSKKNFKNRFLKIWIELLNGSALEVWILPNEPIFNLKLKLEIQEGIPVLKQHLFYGEDELNDCFTLNEYEIEYGSTLKLVVENCKKKNSNSSENFNLEIYPSYIDEQYYNFLFDTKENFLFIKNKNSLTDSKSVDDFRLTNTSSNSGCISVNDKNSEEFEKFSVRSNFTDKLETFLEKMQSWTMRKKKKNLSEERDNIFNRLVVKKKLRSSSFNSIEFIDYKDDFLTRKERIKLLFKSSSLPILNYEKNFMLLNFQEKSNEDFDYKINSIFNENNKKNSFKQHLSVPFKKIILPPVESNSKKKLKCQKCKKKLNTLDKSNCLDHLNLCKDNFEFHDCKKNKKDLELFDFKTRKKLLPLNLTPI